jgi:hypothetical protein
MRTTEAESVLVEMLNAAGVAASHDLIPLSEADSSIVQQVLSVWKAFVALPVEAPPSRVEDDLLFETGIYDDPLTEAEQAQIQAGEPEQSLALLEARNKRSYQLRLVRQFSFYDASDSYDHMEQLQLTLLYEPIEPLSTIDPVVIWSDPHLEAFFQRVEGSQGFRVPRESSLSPTALFISHDRV